MNQNKQMITYHKKLKINGSKLILDVPTELQNIEVEILIIAVKSSQKKKINLGYCNFQLGKNRILKLLNRFPKILNNGK